MDTVQLNVPWEKGMSAMTALDYIYENLDSTIAVYDHAGCDLGICARCTGKINKSAGFFCQTPIDESLDEIILEPRSMDKDRVLKDLITKNRKK